MKSKSIDLSAFDAITTEGEGQPLELYFKGNPTGVTLFVLGSNADVVRAYHDSKLVDYAKQAFHAKKKGEDAELSQSLKVLGNRDKEALESALVRVVGWDGASYKGSEEFTKDALRAVLERNPIWVSEIIEFSVQLGK